MRAAKLLIIGVRHTLTHTPPLSGDWYRRAVPVKVRAGGYQFAKVEWLGFVHQIKMCKVKPCTPVVGSLQVLCVAHETFCSFCSLLPKCRVARFHWFPPP